MSEIIKIIFDNPNAELKVFVQGTNSVNEYKAIVTWFDSIKDLATVSISDKNFNGFANIPYRIKTGANLGQNVFTLGYPLQDVMGFNIKLSTGMITGTTGVRDNDYAYTLDLNLNPGNSGGPLFNNSGDVIGMVEARSSEEAVGVKVENVSYAIKSETFFWPSLQKISETIPNILKTLSLEEKIKRIKPFIVIIKSRGKY